MHGQLTRAVAPAHQEDLLRRASEARLHQPPREHRPSPILSLLRSLNWRVARRPAPSTPPVSNTPLAPSTPLASTTVAVPTTAVAHSTMVTPVVAPAAVLIAGDPATAPAPDPAP
jgi:hypothetical protein